MPKQDKVHQSTLEKSGVWTEREAAAYLGISRSSLAQGRMDGRRVNRMTPPPYIQLGRAIRYRRSDLDKWLDDHRVEF